MVRHPELFAHLSISTHKKKKGVISQEKGDNAVEVATEYLNTAYVLASRFKLRRMNQIQRMKRRFNRRFQNSIDIAEYRVRKLYLESTGIFLLLLLLVY